MRRTLTVVAVATELLTAPGSARWSYGLAKAIGVDRGSVNAILRRMTDKGWLVAEWETDTIVSRPRRCYYHVTTTGRQELADLIGKTEESVLS